MYWADSQRAHEMQAHEVIVIDDYEQLQPSITCKKPRPADEQPSGGKDARAGATSKKPRPADWCRGMDVEARRGWLVWADAWAKWA
jgi:hypothetical protein